jgi:uncharacterized membrane protein YbhN (UPF0104 family)
MLVRSRHGKLALLVAIVAVVTGVAVWRAPDLDMVGGAFAAVKWQWVLASFAANLLSTWFRIAAWQVALEQALPRPHPRHRHIVSAFSVGLLANAVLPGRVGEFARVAVLARHLERRAGVWPSVVGSIVVHRLFDVIPTAGLAAYVLVTARLPGWAVPGLEVMLGVGGILLGVGFLLARPGRRQTAGGRRVVRLLATARHGFAVLRTPGPAVAASLLQLAAWALQLFAVWLAFRGFQLEEPIAAAALVLLVVNVALAFPLWPGAVGLFQAAVALALLPYGIGYDHGFAFGVGLQAIETTVGVGLGLAFLAREGLSLAALRQMPKVTGDVEGPAEPKREPVALRRRLGRSAQTAGRVLRGRPGVTQGTRAGALRRQARDVTELS